MVRIGRAVRAVEPADFLARDRFDRAAAQEVVLEGVLSENGMAARDIDLFELYSCFPVVQKMARRVLGLPEDAVISVTGGLTFFGGPANNYMTHAIAGAVRSLREGKGRAAMLYGQGEFVTKHAAVVLTGSSGPTAGRPGLEDLQCRADARRGDVPPLLQSYEGPAALETFTVLHDRDGRPEWAPVVLRTPAGERVLAAAVASGHMFEMLMDPVRDPIGAQGRVVSDSGGYARWAV
jgi:hypothetical protein